MIDRKLIKAIFKGGLTFIPGISTIVNKTKVAQHSGSSADFCYAYWLSLLSYFKERNISVNLNRVGEIGTGGALGMGICAILTGSERYFAIDIENEYDESLNQKLLREIVNLFKSKRAIPLKIPHTNIQISRLIPIEDLIGGRYLNDKLISEISDDLKPNNVNPIRIRKSCNINKSESFNLNFLFSRAVMEHVKDPESIYKNTHKHVNANSFIFHDIEFHPHDITSSKRDLNQINPVIWKIIFGKRGYFLNRWNLIKHINAIEKEGFIITDLQVNYETESDPINKNIIGATIIARPLLSN